MFQPSPEWTQEERDKVMEELFAGIKADSEREGVLFTADYPARVGRIVCSLLGYTADELEKVRDDMLWDFAN